MARPINPDNPSRAALLDAAEQFFSTRGYAAVRLREIAIAAGLHHASLYHYCPGGKEELYVVVMERSFARHRQGVEDAVRGAPPDLRARLYAVADWFVAQAPVDTARMTLSDFPELNHETARHLAELAYNALREPIVAVLIDARAELRSGDLNTAAMALVTLVQSAHTVPAAYLFGQHAKASIARAMVDMLLDGWLLEPSYASKES